MFEWIASFFNSIFGFIVLMGILVTIHEFGHFYVAKRLGFKILTFRIGFGKAVWHRHGKDGVNYQLGLIPLGGYVEMLDERAHEVAENEMHLTFNAKPIWKRFCVIAAGPAANIVLAFVLLWGLFMYGVPATKPYLGTPTENSIFAEAGFQNRDLVTSVNGKEVVTLDDFAMKMIDHLNGSGQANVTVLRDNRYETLSIDLAEPIKLDRSENIYHVLGLRLYQPDLADADIPARVGFILDESLAANSGILVGDEIAQIGTVPVNHWGDLEKGLNAIRQNPAVSQFEIVVKRGTEFVTLPASLTAEQKAVQKELKLGIGLGGITLEDLPESMQAEIKGMEVIPQYGPIKALKYAAIKTKDDSLMIFKFIGRMIKGSVNVNNMAGPVTIAEVAGKTLNIGVVYFISLMAMFSINLGVINLFPIPVLDGGRLVGLLIEKVVGRGKIPEKLSMMTLQFGAMLVLFFMGFVILNDIFQYIP